MCDLYDKTGIDLLSLLCHYCGEVNVSWVCKF